jgi:hypothetical protein
MRIVIKQLLTARMVRKVYLHRLNRIGLQPFHNPFGLIVKLCTRGVTKLRWTDFSHHTGS